MLRTILWIHPLEHHTALDLAYGLPIPAQPSGMPGMPKSKQTAHCMNIKQEITPMHAPVHHWHQCQSLNITTSYHHKAFLWQLDSWTTEVVIPDPQIFSSMVKLMAIASIATIQWGLFSDTCFFLSSWSMPKLCTQYSFNSSMELKIKCTRHVLNRFAWFEA
jgi:hypothetical protein